MAEKDEKTEQPTDRRKGKAEEKGDIARSKDLTAAVSLFLTVLMFAVFMSYFSRILVDFSKKYFSRVGEIDITMYSIYYIGKDFFSNFLLVVAPIFLLLIIVAFVMEMLQGQGFRIVTENLKIKWEKVFFLGEIPNGLKKILMSPEAMGELVKSIVKVFIIFGIAYTVIRAQLPAIMELPFTSLEHILEIMGKVFLKLSLYIILFLLVLGVVDYLWQRYRYIKKLKMSKEDIKDEFKQTEGDPKIKSRQRKIQFQWAMRRMMAEVPEADVVITNPSHYAVALQYEYKKMKSPKLLAKGKDLIAQKIKEIAKEHDIPVVENPPVARAVFASVEIGDFIPAELFKPIAEILAYIYKLKGKRLA